MKHKVLVIDDDVCVHDSFESIFSNDHFNLEFFDKPEIALAALKQNPFSYAVAFVDYQYKDEEGHAKHLGHLLVKEFKKLNPALKTIIMSGDESEFAAHEWVSARADKIMYKPLKPAHLVFYSVKAYIFLKGREKFSRKSDNYFLKTNYLFNYQMVSSIHHQAKLFARN